MIHDIKNNTQISMNNIIDMLSKKINMIRTGSASPGIIENIKVNVYGKIIKLKYLANIIVEDYKTLKIILFDYTLCTVVKKAIIDSNLGFNPFDSTNNIVRISLPPLTEERRKNLIKILNTYIEDGKISIRNLRRDANKQIKVLFKDKSINKDDEFYAQSEIQLLTDNFIEQINNMLNNKTNEIMKF